MIEVEALANKLEIELPVAFGQRIAGAEKIGEHKTSMLQDRDAGHPVELNAVAGAGPHTRGIYACTTLLDVVLIGGIK